MLHLRMFTRLLSPTKEDVFCRRKGRSLTRSEPCQTVNGNERGPVLVVSWRLHPLPEVSKVQMSCQGHECRQWSKFRAPTSDVIPLSTLKADFLPPFYPAPLRSTFPYALLSYTSRDKYPQYA